MNSVLTLKTRLQPDFNRPINIDVPVFQAGAFDFHTTYTPLPTFTTGVADVPEPTRTPTYYIDVCPKLKAQGQTLPLNSLSIFSLISKFMGEYPTQWEKHLTGIAERGYNMVHFTPLNLRGDSNSPYSIADQLSFDPQIFPNGEKDIEDLTTKMEQRHGLLSLTDVVWNHTANNSEWLQDHPEAGYSVKTAPHLEPALRLDTELLNFSNAMGSLGYPTDLKSTDDLLKVMEGVKKHCIAKCKLWEFYVCDVEKDCAAGLQSWKEGMASLRQCRSIN
jgi:glycogen debranching enzyme